MNICVINIIVFTKEKIDMGNLELNAAFENVHCRRNLFKSSGYF